MFLSKAPFYRWGNPNKTLIGLNCFQPFGYGYPFANGGNDATVMPDARITGLKTVGFDFLRMVVDPEPLLSADSASNVTTTVLDSRIAEVIAGMARRTALGLKVIVDMHFHGDAVSYAAGWSWTDVFDGGTKAARLSFVLGRLGAAIHATTRTTGKPSNVAFEIFNEPPNPSSISTATYITNIETWWAATRAAMPLHTIIVGGNGYNAIDGTFAGAAAGLTSLTASHFDINTGFAIHQYESPTFTHQAVPGFYQDVHGLTFPATSHTGGRAQAESTFTTDATANGDSGIIDGFVNQTSNSYSFYQYFNTYGTKALLATYLANATSWGDSAGISRRRILNTESGVNFGGATDATAASAAAYIQALRENAEAAGLGSFVVHEMQGSDFGIQSSSNPWALNASIQAALFP
jgi:endoglucanase